MDGFGEKSVNKLLENIKKSANISLTNFIVALNIPLIGKAAAKTIAKICKQDVRYLTELLDNNYDWTQIDGFGEEMNQAIKARYASCNNNEIVMLINNTDLNA